MNEKDFLRAAASYLTTAKEIATDDPVDIKMTLECIETAEILIERAKSLLKKQQTK